MSSRPETTGHRSSTTDPGASTDWRRPSTPWHKASYDHFLHHGLPDLLKTRLGITGYRVETESTQSCCIHLEAVGSEGHFTIDYPHFPVPDEDGAFRVAGLQVADYPMAWTPDLPVQRFAHEDEIVVTPMADRDDLDQAQIACVGEQLITYIEPRLGQLPPEVELDPALLRSLAPLDTWIRAFFTHGAQRLNGNNWLDRATHLRRIAIPDRKDVFTSGHFGRTCPFESPEGPNVGRILTVSRGADIRDGRLVIMDDAPEAGLGLAAACLPFLEHDDGNRVLMGVNMMRQWVPPTEREPALVQTGDEPEGVDFWAGRNLLTAFLSWDEGTFEDALVLSETAAQKLACPYVLEPGDKLSNRHGIKGVISRVLPDDQMPRLPDGTPLELLYSVCGVPSRWAVGQLREAAISHVARVEGSPVLVAPFHAPSDDELSRQVQAVGLPADGMLQLTDGDRPLRRRTTAGWVYWGCTIHLAREKMYAATAPDQKCQMVGPMEAQGLREAGAIAVLQEFTNTCSAERPDAATLAERVAAGPLEPATTPSPRFEALTERLGVANIAAEASGSGVHFSATEPIGPLKLARSVPHPWLSDQLLSHVNIVDDTDGQQIVETNRRLTELLAGDAPEPIINGALEALSGAVANQFDRLLSTECLSFGSRVLFSARSILIPGGDLATDQLGIPDELAWTLFGPQTARRIGDLAAVEQRTDAASAALDQVLSEAWIILHRAPTTGRTSLLAFQPVRRPGRAIHLHPLACHLLDADFDGDQAALFVPLTEGAIAESREHLSVAGHLRDEPDLVSELAPAMDAIFGLACLSRSADGRRAIADIIGPGRAPTGALLDRKATVGILRDILRGDGVDAAVQAASLLMRAGFEAARREGASIGPFIGTTLDLPAPPVTDEFDHWQAWQQEIFAIVEAFDDYDDEDVGVVHLLSHSGARANTHQVASLFAPGGPVHDAEGNLVPVRHCWREGLTATETLVRVIGARRGLFNIRQQIAALEEDHNLRSSPQGHGVLSRARRCNQPGIIFARAAQRSETDPLKDEGARLFVGLPD